MNVKNNPVTCARYRSFDTLGFRWMCPISSRCCGCHEDICTHSHTFLWAPSSLNSHRPFLFWVSEKRSESQRNFSCLREWKTHSRGMQSRLLQRLSSTSTLALSPLFFLSIFHLLLTPTVTIHPYTHTHTLCLSLSSAGQCLWADGCVSVQMWWETAVAVLCSLSFFLFSLLLFHPSLFPEITGWWVYDPFIRTPSVQIFCGWSFIDMRSSFTDLLWNVSTAVFEEKQIIITFWFPIILYFLYLLYGSESFGTSYLNPKFIHSE